LHSFSDEAKTVSTSALISFDKSPLVDPADLNERCHFYLHLIAATIKHFCGATTLSKMTFGMTTLGKMTLRMMTVGKMTLCIITLGKMTFPVMTVT
jgi:hypothetical protein